MANSPYATAGSIIAAVATQVGLSAGSDPYVSTDQNIQQMCALLSDCGGELWRLNEWTQLQQSVSFTTVAGIGRYPLPDDFGAMVNQTQWNRSNRLPMAGPLSPQLWQYLKAAQVGVVFNVLFRPAQNQLWLYPDTNTPGGYNIAFEYRSRYWTVPAGTTASLGSWNNGMTVAIADVYSNGGNLYRATSAGVTGNNGPTGTTGSISDGVVTWAYVSPAGSGAPAASNDVVLFDAHLCKRMLKLSWLQAKGFDTTAATADFVRALEQVQGLDGGADVLNAGDGDSDSFLLGDKNVPITGYGFGS